MNTKKGTKKTKKSKLAREEMDEDVVCVFRPVGVDFTSGCNGQIFSSIAVARSTERQNLVTNG